MDKYVVIFAKYEGDRDSIWESIQRGLGKALNGVVPMGLNQNREIRGLNGEALVVYEETFLSGEQFREYPTHRQFFEDSIKRSKKNCESEGIPVVISGINRMQTSFEPSLESIEPKLRKRVQVLNDLDLARSDRPDASFEDLSKLDL